VVFPQILLALVLLLATQVGDPFTVWRELELDRASAVDVRARVQPLNGEVVSEAQRSALDRLFMSSFPGKDMKFYLKNPRVGG